MLENKQNEEDSAKRMIFYSSGDFETLKKTLQAQERDKHEEQQIIEGENLTFPQCILAIKSWDSLIPDLTHFIEETKEKNIQREKAEREKKLQVR